MGTLATRRERVVLELEDNFSSGMARAAASAALLDKTLNSLSGSAVDTRKSVLDLNGRDGLPGLARNSETAGRQIDRMSGRLKILAQSAAILGPALVPISAVAIPAVSGLAAQLGFAALAGGTAIVAFQGVGTALEAMNKAHLEPTAENLEAAREAMQDLSPAAREFVVEVRKMAPAMQELRDAAAEGMFPGLLDGMDAIEARLPDVERILSTVGEAVGEILGDTGESLASARWDDFFDFLATDATSALSELASSVGNVTHGLAEMWMAFDPLNDSFSSWLVQVTEDFDAWATGLSQTNGFREFIDYIQTNGPRVAEAMGAIGNALVEIVQAAAPIGGVVLVAIEAFADVISAIADSDLGTPIFGAIAAMSALSLATTAWGAVSMSAAGKFVASQTMATTALNGTKLSMAGLGKSAALLAGVTLASTDMAEGFELSNTASLALIGTMAGPWGAAAGAAAGFAMDFAAANDDIAASLERVNAAFESGTIGEQRTALRDLKATTDEASAGFVELFRTVENDGEGGLKKLGSSLIPAAFSAFNVLTGATGEAREEYERFKGSIGGSDLGRMIAEPLGLAEDAFLNANAALEQFENSFRRLNNLLTRSSTLIAYEQALDDLTASIKENGNAWDASTNKGRANLEARNRLVQTAIDRSQALREEGDKLGAQRILQRAIKDLESFGNNPAAKNAIKDLVAELERLDRKHAKPKVEVDNKPAKSGIDDANSWLLDYGNKKAESTVDVNTGPAAAGIAWINNALNQIPDEQVFVNVTTRRTNEGGGFGAVGSADGSTVPKTGKGYADRHLYLLADGEEVISNRHGQADRYRSLLKAINANQRLATGGTTGGSMGGKIQRVPGLESFDGVNQAIRWLERHANGAGDQFERLARAAEKELRGRVNLFEKELKHADKKMQAELDALKELKAARKELIAATAGNFLTEPFGDVDLMEAFRNGALDMTQVHGFASAQGLDTSTPEAMMAAVQSYLASLSAAEIAALQVQASAGNMQNSTQDARRFEELLATLSGDLGFDGGAFQQLAMSGNIAQAQWLAQQTPEYIEWFEQQYAAQIQAAQNAGQVAGNAEYAAAIKDQTKVFREAREDFRDAKQSLRQLNRRIDHLERLAEKNPKDTGRETANALNGTAAKANRSA